MAGRAGVLGMRAYQRAFAIVAIAGLLLGACLVIWGVGRGDYPGMIAGGLIVAACIASGRNSWRDYQDSLSRIGPRISISDMGCIFVACLSFLGFLAMWTTSGWLSRSLILAAIFLLATVVAACLDKGGRE
ncbi:MAG: hypothetical protein ACJ74Z_19900 [Bryobacteraceae bacterium]|jgi:hypothetical protein